MKLVLALALVSLSGCFVLTDQQDPTPPPFTDDELAGLFNETQSVTLHAKDFVNGSLVLQVLTSPGVPVSLALDGSLAITEGANAAGREVEEASPKPCVSVFTPNYRYVAFGALRQPIIIANTAGQGAALAAPSYGVDYTLDVDTQLEEYSEGYPISVAIGVADAEAWDNHGSLTLQLTSAEPFNWRALPGGSLTCSPLISEEEGGTAVDTGAAMAVRDKTVGLESDGSGMVAMYIGATGNFEARFSGPGGFDTTYADQLNWVFGYGLLEAGSYLLEVDELAGSNVPVGQEVPTGAQLMWHDVPDWVLLPPWEVPAV